MTGMRVLVTGGTGFVGGHVTSALVRAGHDVRLLVRRAEQVPVTLTPLGVTVADVLVGDVTDPDSVGNALDGMDAVVHAAAVFSLDPRRVQEVTTTNLRAAELVLQGAVKRGLDPVVHISSTVALTRKAGSDESLPLGDIDLPYCQSKIRSERVARELQETGSPVVCVYPGGVFGPHDPYLGDQNERLRWLVRGLLPLWPVGGMHCVDVRDVAAVVQAVLEPGRGPRRYVVPGQHIDGAGMFAIVEKVVGRRRPHATIPARLIPVMTKPMGLMNRVLPAGWHIPADYEGALVLSFDTHVPDRAARVDLGVEPRAFEDTIRDTVRWMVDTGRISRRYVA